MISIAHPERYDDYKPSVGTPGRSDEWELVAIGTTGPMGEIPLNFWGHLKPEYRQGRMDAARELAKEVIQMAHALPHSFGALVPLCERVLAEARKEHEA